MRKTLAVLAGAVLLAGHISAANADEPEWGQISTETIHCMTSELHGMVYKNRIEWTSTKWTIGHDSYVDENGDLQNTKHWKNSMYFDLKMGRGGSYERFDLTQVKVQRDTKKCYRLVVKATTPYDGKRFIEVVTFDKWGEPGSWSYNYNTKVGKRLLG